MHSTCLAIVLIQEAVYELLIGTKIGWIKKVELRHRAKFG